MWKCFYHPAPGGIIFSHQELELEWLGAHLERKGQKGGEGGGIRSRREPRGRPEMSTLLLGKGCPPRVYFTLAVTLSSCREKTVEKGGALINQLFTQRGCPMSK